MQFRHITTLVSSQLKREAAWHQLAKPTDPALRILTELAFTIDGCDIPIDYRRRRDLAARSTLIDEGTWGAIARATGTRTGRGSRTGHARRYLYELITGCRLHTAPPPYQLTAQPAGIEYGEFAVTITASLASALHDHARSLLASWGINIDLDWLHEQYLTWHRTLADIAAEAGCTTAALKQFAHEHGVPVRPRGTGRHISPDTAAGRHPSQIPEPLRQALRGPHGTQRLHRLLIIAQHPGIRQAAQALGIPESVLYTQIARLERDCGGPVITAGPAPG